MRLQRNNSIGMTLVELLVTMAIATILIAIVLPATIQSRNRARGAACFSNLRQLANAVTLYAQDNGDRLPKLPGSAFAGSFHTPEWTDGSSATAARILLRRSAPAQNVFRCPNDIGAPEYGFARSAGSVFSSAGTSYAVWSTTRPGRFGLTTNGALVSSLFPASVHVLFRDYGSSWHGRSSRSGLSVQSLAYANALFADGHAKAAPVFEFETANGFYACTAVKMPRRGIVLSLAGEANGGRVEMTGRYTTDPSGSYGITLQLSGRIFGSGGALEVDREFSYGSEADLESALRQVVYWVDNLLAA